MLASLGSFSFFCSVNLLDFFLSNYSFKNHQLITLSFATLVLASKLLESSKKVILFSEIKPFMISNQETNFLDLERKILCHMNFNVNTVSSYDFLMYLLTEFFEERFFFFFPLWFKPRKYEKIPWKLYAGHGHRCNGLWLFAIQCTCTGYFCHNHYKDFNESDPLDRSNGNVYWHFKGWRWGLRQIS